MKTIEGIKQVFKLKGEKAEPPDMYLGASLQRVETASSEKCWAMSSEKYVRQKSLMLKKSSPKVSVGSLRNATLPWLLRIIRLKM